MWWLPGDKEMKAKLDMQYEGFAREYVAV